MRGAGHARGGLRDLALALLALLVAAPLAGCGPPPSARAKQVFHLTPYERDLGYSQAVLVNKTLYISGSVAVDLGGHPVAGDMSAQLRAAYANLQRTLAAHGVGFDAVVKETLFTTDMEALLKASDLRFEFYDKERLPASSWVQVQRLVDPGFLVEIEAIAELP